MVGLGLLVARAVAAEGLEGMESPVAGFALVTFNSAVVLVMALSQEDQALRHVLLFLGQVAGG